VSQYVEIRNETKVQNLPANSTHGEVKGPPDQHLVMFKHVYESQVMLRGSVSRDTSTSTVVLMVNFSGSFIGRLLDMVDWVSLRLAHDVWMLRRI